VSKVCNIPMAKIATRVMMGRKIKELGLVSRPVHHFGVKESVFPFNMFPEVDPVLGPEMRSTGEVLGLADSFGLAFFKAQEAANQLLPFSGTALITVNPSDRDSALDVAAKFTELGFSLMATEGTHRHLAEHGIASETVLKIYQGRPHIIDRIKNGDIQLIINTPSGKQSEHDDSYIRKSAIRYRIPYITTMAAAMATARGIQERRTGETDVRSLQQYHQQIEPAGA
ncbi:MAG TPA: carbamoyl phosphate synthase large subunit, partial [Spirochaetes bacterium]|nr:carbamoyl phosphate synthase large subunit [Spirochaetota bacterium]